MTKTSSGFTLVELLVVIVVIAILASISVVTYSGIQDRARVAVAKSSLSTIGKKITLYEVQTGSYLARATAKSLIAEGHGSTPGANDYVTCLNTTNGGYAITVYDPLKPSGNGSDELYYTSSPSGSVQSGTYTMTHATTAGSICNSILPGWNGAYWYGSL